MKRILLIVLALIACLLVSARQPERGYRGFVDWNNSIRLYYNDGWIPTPKYEYSYYSGISTSHGYQITPVWFVGAGLSIEHSRHEGRYILPVFLEGRADFKWGKFTPFADLKAGYHLTDNGGPYISPSIGYRFNWGRKVGINLAIGCAFKCYSVDIIHYELHPGSMNPTRIVEKDHYIDCPLCLRLGIDF